MLVHTVHNSITIANAEKTANVFREVWYRNAWEGWKRRKSLNMKSAKAAISAKKMGQLNHRTSRRTAIAERIRKATVTGKAIIVITNCVQIGRISPQRSLQLRRQILLTSAS